MDIQITKHFKLSEFLYSDTVDSLKRTCPALFEAQNSISHDVYDNLRLLCACVLEPARKYLGIPIHINSGYRCPQLNKRVKGSSTSQHLNGEAADITCIDNLALFNYLKMFDFDQLIWYGNRANPPRFIHVSFKSSCSNRKMILYKP